MKTPNYSNRNASQRKKPFKSAKKMKSTKSSEIALGTTTGTSSKTPNTDNKSSTTAQVNFQVKSELYMSKYYTILV